jgi:hypothetical protein
MEVVVRLIDEPEPHTIVRPSFVVLPGFDMTEEDRLFDFMKGLQPTPKCPRLRASLLDGKYLGESQA